MASIFDDGINNKALSDQEFKEFYLLLCKVFNSNMIKIISKFSDWIDVFFVAWDTDEKKFSDCQPMRLNTDASFVLSIMIFRAKLILFVFFLLLH